MVVVVEVGLLVVVVVVVAVVGLIAAVVGVAAAVSIKPKKCNNNGHHLDS